MPTIVTRKVGGDKRRSMGRKRFVTGGKTLGKAFGRSRWGNTSRKPRS